MIANIGQAYTWAIPPESKTRNKKSVEVYEITSSEETNV
jgi:hypothetical protein